MSTIASRAQAVHSVESPPAHDPPLVSVVLPCLNEAEAIGSCIREIFETFAASNIRGEVVVCDNGSTDGSGAIAASLGARVVHEPRRGYGNAYLCGFAHARGRYLVMGDADDTYDFTMIPRLLDLLMNRDCDFVTGSRYLGHGSRHIPLLHRLVGNPALTALLNSLFGTRYTDVYCGLRAFSRDAYDLIKPASPGMEFNLELAINAGRARLRTAEVPITLRPRKGSSKLRTVRDGWRSLRLMLLFSPNALFIWPGGTLFMSGALLHAMLLLGVLQWGGRRAAGVTALFAMMACILGFQILNLGLHAKTYAWTRRFEPRNRALERFYRHFTLERGLAFGAAVAAGGATMLAAVIAQWLSADMLPVPHPERASLAATLVLLGCGIVFSSLFISAMSIEKPRGVR
jgi:glycosyltransferase involved in cell wall biosynthesis